MCGMAVGVALLIVVLSVMNGFDREMRTRILGLVPQINVLSYGQGAEHAQDWLEVEAQVRLHPDVVAVAPFVQLNAMLLKGTAVEGVLIYGIDPQREQEVSVIGDYVNRSALDTLSDKQEKMSRSILLGAAVFRLAIILTLWCHRRIKAVVSRQSFCSSPSPHWCTQERSSTNQWHSYPSIGRCR